MAGGTGSYGNSSWEGDPVIYYNGRTWNFGNLCVPKEGGASPSITDKETDAHMTIAKASLKLSIDPNGGTWNGSSSISKVDAITGYTDTISTPTRGGYIFTGWTVTGTGSTISGNQFTMGSQDATLKANWSPSSAKYKVHHWKQNVDGDANEHNSNNYTLEETENLTGGVGSRVTPSVKSSTEYPGFISPVEQTKTITADGNTVINYYYARKSYTVTLNKGIGIDTVNGEGSYIYGGLVVIDATLLPGFKWSDWSGTYESDTDEVTSQRYSFNMPAKDIMFTANGIPEEFIITYDLNGGEASGNPDSYTPQTSSFTLINPTRPGYTFTGWTGSNGETPEKVVTISKGSTGNRDYIANWIANTDTPYLVRHWTQNVGGRVDAKNEENYTIREEDELIGTTDTEVTPIVKTYEGFTSPEVQTKIIAGDGNLIVDYYYTRNKYTVTLNKEQGVATVLGAGEYEFEQDVTINVMIKAGYDWVKWLGEDEIRDLKVIFKMPAKDVEYTTVTMPNPNTKYTIQHWKQKLEGNEKEYNEQNYELANTDIVTGETDSMISPETRDYEGFKKPDANGISVPITGEGTLLIKYYYTRSSYEVKLNKGKGIEEIKSKGNITGEGKERYLYGEEVEIEAKVKPGYTWSNWTGQQQTEDIVHTFTMETRDVEYTANATPDTNIPYKVQHWQQNLTGIAEIQNDKNYTLVDTDTDLEGTTDTEVIPQVKRYAGFTSPEGQTVVISGDGSLEVNYYYTRNLDTPYKVEHWIQNIEGEKDSQNEQNYTKNETDELEGTTGASVTPETKDYKGFTAPEKQTAEITGDGNLVIKYYYTRNSNTAYRVKHWIQKLEGMAEPQDSNNYTLRDVEDFQGITDMNIRPETKDYEGFTAPYIQVETIKGDGTTEINYYYTRNSYTVTLNKGTGIENVIGANLYLYEQLIEIDTTILPGYTWSKWTGSNETTTQNYRFIMPAENLEYTANAIPNTNTPYKVQHWKQNLEGNAEIRNEDNYTLIDTDELEGTTGESVTPEIREYEGYIAPEKQTAEILGNGRLIVNYYYTRRTDLTCTVKHIEKETGRILEENTLENLTYEQEIEAKEKIIEMGEYKYESLEPEILKVGLEENIINIYYVKKEGRVIVHHYIYNEKEDKYTTTKIAEDQEIIGELGDEYTTTSIKDIPENYIVVNETPEDYAGIIEEGTKEIKYYYKLKKPEIGSDVEGGIISGGTQDEDGKWDIKAGEEIKYKVKYKTEIEDYKGKVKIEVRAALPEGTRINVEKCDFAEGTYNKETNTITWTKEIENINTFTNGLHTEEIVKYITIVYTENYKLESMELDITGKTILYYPGDGTGGEEGEEDKPLIEDEANEKGKVIVHHYIYDVEDNEYTTTKLLEDEEIIKKVGNKYTTHKSIQIPENYRCINETPEGYKGEITKQTIEVNYYYELKMPETDNKTESETIEGGTQDEEGNWIIKAGEELKYKISYESKIKDYKGKVKIEIKAKLPEGTKINQTKSKLSGGIYEKESNTITWTKDIEEINTFKNGEYIEKINKQISIVYAEDYILEDIKLNITGNTKLYYPEDYIEKGEDTTIGGGKITIHHYLYEENENKYTTTKIVGDEEIIKKVGEEYITKKSKNIPENYECINDKPERYKGTVTKQEIEVSYYYKLKKPTLDTSAGGETIEGGGKTEDGKWSIKAGEEIKYKIKYKTEIEDYKGKAKIEIKAKLPEGTTIDQEKSKLAEGTYEETTNTITWVEEIENIDTFANTEKEIENKNTSVQKEGTANVGADPVSANGTDGEYINGIYTLKIEKDITIIYESDYIIENITPKVTGKTTLYTTDGKGEIIVDETDEKGKVIIHHYIYDKETDTYTNIKLVENEQIKGEIGEKYKTNPSEKIPSNYECLDSQPEGYEGKYTKETIKVDYYYKLKESTTEGETEGTPIEGGEQTEDGKLKVKAGEEIKYRVKYKTKIKDYKGKVKIEVKAILQERTEIDLRKSNLANGVYDEATNTITWVKEIEDVDTFANGPYEETITKDIIIVYEYDYVLDNYLLEVRGKTILYYPDDYPTKGEGDGTLTEDETGVEGKIIVHHYIYDEAENIYTTTKLISDEIIKGKIEQQYTTKKSNQVPSNYECINEQPEGYTGTIAKEEKEVNYYYKLKTPTVEGGAEQEIISGVEQDKEGNWVIKAGKEVKYKLSYKTKIKDYKGKAKVEIKAKLPEGTKIDINKSDLKGGIYEETTNTIIWTKEIENIDTFAHKEDTTNVEENAKKSANGIDGEYIEGIYTLKIEKEIAIVYDNDYVLKDAKLKVIGNTTLYYPEDYPMEKDEPFIKNEVSETGKIIVHHYIYNQEENKYTDTKIVPDEEIEKEIGEEYETKPSGSRPANYTCVNDRPEGYKGTIEKGTKEITYYYKLIETTTQGSGEAEIIEGVEQDEEGNWIIKAGKEVKYNIKYEGKIENYIGKAKIEIKAELAKGTKIDINKSDLKGGIYNEGTNTITWTKEIENINTFENGTYTETIEKEITIVYAEDYVLKDANLKITGKITTYYPENYPDKGGQERPSDNENNNPEDPGDNNPDDNPEEKTGKIIVKYVDKDTNEEINDVGAPLGNPDNETFGYEITGKIGTEYETEEKEIPYYVLERIEGSKKGEIKEGIEIVTYYYRKQDFNIGIEKTIEEISLNGKKQRISNKETAKLELKKDEIKKTELIVKYNIKITNKGELGGTSRIIENIPEGYEIAYLPTEWRANRNRTLETKVDLEAGQSKELDVVLIWENKEENLGAKTNIAKIEETGNKANYKDTNEKDNQSEATVIVSIKTGEVVSAAIIMMIITSLGICGYVSIVLIHKKGTDIKDIKFLK